MSLKDMEVVTLVTAGMVMLLALGCMMMSGWLKNLEERVTKLDGGDRQ